MKTALTPLQITQAGMLSKIADRLNDATDDLVSISNGLTFLKDDFYKGYTNSEQQELAAAINIIYKLAAKTMTAAKDVLYDESRLTTTSKQEDI